MPKSLPNHWQLISESWKLYLETWNESIRVSIWFLYIGLIHFTVYLAVKLNPYAVYPGIIVAVGVLALASWTIIRLFETGLRLDEGKKIELSQEAMKRSWKSVLPLLWIGLLQMLVILGASIPLVAWQYLAPKYLVGLITDGVYLFMQYVLILPPLYVVVRLSFAQLIAVDQRKRGLEALAVSNELVSGRWMEIFSRQATAAIIIGGGIWIVLSLLFAILGALVGPEKFVLMSDPSTADPLLLGVMQLIEGIVQAAVMPLILIFVVKLYKSLKRSG